VLVAPSSTVAHVTPACIAPLMANATTAVNAVALLRVVCCVLCVRYTVTDSTVAGSIGYNFTAADAGGNTVVVPVASTGLTLRKQETAFPSEMPLGVVHCVVVVRSTWCGRGRELVSV
jgi:hypothetical protein